SAPFRGQSGEGRPLQGRARSAGGGTWRDARPDRDRLDALPAGHHVRSVRCPKSATGDRERGSRPDPADGRGSGKDRRRSCAPSDRSRCVIAMQLDDGSNASPHLQRDASLDRVRADGAFDVIVVGGGINGIGVFRELSLQDLRVLLVEKRDFCSGCSAAPSRMIHGGLRYLENGEFGLVRESLRERDALLRNAPHMVRPLPTTIPIKSIFSGTMNAAIGFLGGKSRPAERGVLPVKLGLML